MKVLTVCVVLAALACTLEASPSKSAESNSHNVMDTLQRFLMDERKAPYERRSLYKRQQNPVCTENSDCYPSGKNYSVPTSLIECVGGLCSCNECFEVGSNGTCVEVSCEDWTYDQAGLRCDDDRPKQLTAFLLSFFVSSTGAANFYIGRDDLGGAQLFLLLFMIFISYVMCYLPCCMGCCMAKDDVKGSLVFIALILVMVILLILLVLAIWAWWLADLIIFATNKRDSGNGCMLQDDL